MTDEQKLLFLEALDQAGVDNWEGYDFAIDIYRDLLKANGLEEEDED